LERRGARGLGRRGLSGTEIGPLIVVFLLVEYTLGIIPPSPAEADEIGDARAVSNSGTVKCVMLDIGMELLGHLAGPHLRRN